jgi:hypothetical protein
MRRDGHVVAMMTVAFMATGGALDGQILLRYAPGIGSTYRMHVWTAATTTVTRGMGGNEVLVVELDGRESLTRRVASEANGVLVVEMARDSATVRVRRDGGEWGPAEAPFGQLRSSTVRIDDRLNVLSAPPEAGQLLRGLAGGTEAPLPERPIDRFQTWTTPLGVRLIDAAIPRVDINVPEARIGDRLRVDATFVLDSVLTRGGETLVFMSYQGVIAPVTRTVPSDVASSSVTIGGTSDGVLIWSTLWDAYVSGSSHTHVAMRVRVFVYGDEPTTELALDSDVVSRFQVRP